MRETERERGKQSQSCIYLSKNFKTLQCLQLLTLSTLVCFSVYGHSFFLFLSEMTSLFSVLFMAYGDYQLLYSVSSDCVVQRDECLCLEVYALKIEEIVGSQN